MQPITTWIFFAKESTLYKKFKKAGLITDQDYEALFVQLGLKPNIGELIEVTIDLVPLESQKELYEKHFKETIFYVRIVDLIHYNSSGLMENKVHTVLYLRAIEEKFNQWSPC